MGKSGGFGLMQACDLRVVMDDALLFFPEVPAPGNIST